MSGNSHLNYKLILSLIGTAMAGVGSVRAADHGDTPLLKAAQRHDARLTDLFAFQRGDNLVLIVTLDPTIPPDVTEYVFATDLTVQINVDNHSVVTFDDPDDLEIFGGTIVRPKKIKEKISFRIRFEEDGWLDLRTKGLPRHAVDEIAIFAGLRDDPFIRSPRTGRNIAAIVLELPMDLVIRRRDTLLIWATSRVPELRGKFQDLAGRALRSQFPENDRMNSLHPKKHEKKLGVNADVIIYDTLRPAAFPNGRELIDDVLDLVGDPRPLANDDPFPDANDLPFLDEFPYLPAPHPPVLSANAPVQGESVPSTSIEVSSNAPAPTNE